MNPILLNIHVLAAGFLLAVLVMAIIFLVRRPLSAERLGSIRLAINLAAGAIILEIVTGAGLFKQRTQNPASTILFWVKVGLLILDVILVFWLVNRKLKAVGSAEPEKVVKPSQLLAWTIVNIIVAVVITVLSINIAS